MYIGPLGLTVWAFPAIFVVGFTFLAAFILDAVGVGRIGIAALALFIVLWFAAFLFFSAFAWPHISPTIDKIFAAMLKPPGAR